MNISHSRFILSKLKIFGKTVTNMNFLPRNGKLLAPGVRAKLLRHAD